MLAIGIMSGTSLDGVDCALVEIDNNKFELIKFVTLDYSLEFKNKLAKNLNNDTAKLADISSLNFEISDWFNKAIDKLLLNTNYKYSDISFIASHGQTIWHDPKGEYGRASTLQIGEASVITNHTGITVINNFRAADVAAAGEGAPLVPKSEYLIYSRLNKNIILQNIGGIGNLTYIKKGAKLDEVFAFDTGPGNCMIDFFTKRYFNKPFDENGNIAKSGKIIDKVLDYLKTDSYLLIDPPKSTGRERYSESFMLDLENKLNFSEYKKEDIIKTITYYTAYSIYYHYKKYIIDKGFDIDLVVLGGGGSHNQYIKETLSNLLNKEVLTQEDLGYDSDSKEAMAFAILGYLTLNKECGNVISVTGASKEVILGDVHYGGKDEH